MVSPVVFFVPAIEERYGELCVSRVEQIGREETAQETASRVIQLMGVIKEEMAGYRETYQERFDVSAARLNPLAQEILAMDPNPEIREFMEGMGEVHWQVLHPALSPDSMIDLADRVQVMASALLGGELTPALTREYYEACRYLDGDEGYAGFYLGVTSKLLPDLRSAQLQQVQAMAPNPESSEVDRKFREFATAYFGECDLWDQYLTEQAGVCFAAMVLEADSMRHCFS